MYACKHVEKGLQVFWQSLLMIALRASRSCSGELRAAGKGAHPNLRWAETPTTLEGTTATYGLTASVQRAAPDKADSKPPLHAICV